MSLHQWGLVGQVGDSSGGNELIVSFLTFLPVVCKPAHLLVCFLLCEREKRGRGAVGCQEVEAHNGGRWGGWNG